MKKEKMFFVIGIICAIGALLMLSELNWGATIFYLIIAVVCLVFSKEFILSIFNGSRKQNKLLDTEDEINETKNSASEVQEKAKEMLSNAGETLQKKLADSAKWKTIIMNELSVNKEDKLVKIHRKIYKFEDVVDCELIEDGNSVIKSSLLGTAAKGLTFGLSGYLSAAKKEKKYCNKLYVKITVNDFKKPCLYCKFIKKKTKVQSKEYEKAFNKAHKCISTIKVILENK